MTDDEILARITDQADRIVRADEAGGDPEFAHVDQDALADEVLAWIAEYSTDDRARALAAQALRPFRTEGVRWFA